jgi:hypothetical protein
MHAIWKRVTEDKRDQLWAGESRLMFDFSQLPLELDLSSNDDVQKGG